VPGKAGGDDFTNEFLARGRAQVARLRALSNSIGKPSVRASTVHICLLADQIFAILVADPAKTPLARGFVDYTLTKTLTIITRYCDLSSRGMPSAQPTLEKAESLLAMIDTSFGEQIEKLLREDVADLDSEIEVLQARLELEGDIRE
jgi:5-bromo-4-chloroindolyl phosphate hydrolysis protein